MSSAYRGETARERLRRRFMLRNPDPEPELTPEQTMALVQSFIITVELMEAEKAGSAKQAAQGEGAASADEASPSEEAASAKDAAPAEEAVQAEEAPPAEGAVPAEEAA